MVFGRTYCTLLTITFYVVYFAFHPTEKLPQRDEKEQSNKFLTRLQKLFLRSQTLTVFDERKRLARSRNKMKCRKRRWLKKRRRPGHGSPSRASSQLKHNEHEEVYKV